MTNYRICVSLLSGLGFVSFVCLLLNIPVANFFLLALLMPGGVVVSILPRLVKWDSVPALLATNALIYSILVFAAILLWFRNIEMAKLRQIAIRMVLPAVTISSLACFPSLNRLWPRGMAELKLQESELNDRLSLNIDLQDARAALKLKGIQVNEFVENSEDVVFQGPDKKITANAGDRVLSGLSERSASSFPCTYKMQVILVFGPDEKLRERYVRRSPICP